VSPRSLSVWSPFEQPSLTRTHSAPCTPRGLPSAGIRGLRRADTESNKVTRNSYRAPNEAYGFKFKFKGRTISVTAVSVRILNHPIHRVVKIALLPDVSLHTITGPLRPSQQLNNARQSSSKPPALQPLLGLHPTFPASHSIGSFPAYPADTHTCSGSFVCCWAARHILRKAVEKTRCRIAVISPICHAPDRK